VAGGFRRDAAPLPAGEIYEVAAGEKYDIGMAAVGGAVPDHNRQNRSPQSG
jgi:hypothetical protein